MLGVNNEIGLVDSRMRRERQETQVRPDRYAGQEYVIEAMEGVARAGHKPMPCRRRRSPLPYEDKIASEVVKRSLNLRENPFAWGNPLLVNSNRAAHITRRAQTATAADIHRSEAKAANGFVKRDRTEDRF